MVCQLMESFKLAKKKLHCNIGWTSDEQLAGYSYYIRNSFLQKRF